MTLDTLPCHVFSQVWPVIQNEHYPGECPNQVPWVTGVPPFSGALKYGISKSLTDMAFKINKRVNGRLPSSLSFEKETLIKDV